MKKIHKEGTIIEFNYTAIDKNTNQIIDTTLQEEAKKANIFDEKIQYKPLKVILGEHEIVQGLEEELMKMNEKQEKVIEVKPEKAYGERKADLIKVIPLQEFKKRQLNPFPGLVISVNDLQGKVQTVSGGRVRVDFNHPFAGKTIEFKAKIERIISDDNEKLDILTAKFFPFIEKEKIKKEVKEKEVVIRIPELKTKELTILKDFFVKTAKKCLEDKEIKIEEEKEIQEKTEAKETEKNNTKKLEKKKEK